MRSIFLAFDFGIKSIGVAVGMRITNTARPLTALKAQEGIPDWTMVKVLINEWQPKEIIVGLPLNMDGTEQFITMYARKFAGKINKFFKKTVKFHDERLTTIEARNNLFENGGFRALSKNKIDSESAVIILESYFRQTS